MIDVKELTEVLIEHDLTIEQFYILLLLRDVSKEGGNNDVAKNYINKFGMFSGHDIQALLDKDYVTDFNSPGETFFYHFMANPIKTKSIFLDDDLFDELWNEYPPYLLIQNKQIPSKSDGYDEIKVVYLKMIRRSLKTHEKVMKALRFYKQSESFAKIKLMNFIKSKEWENIIKDEPTRARNRSY